MSQTLSKNFQGLFASQILEIFNFFSIMLIVELWIVRANDQAHRYFIHKCGWLFKVKLMAELALQMCRNLAKIFLYWPTHKTNPTDLQSETLSARVCMHVISIRIRKLLIWPAHASQRVRICLKTVQNPCKNNLFWHHGHLMVWGFSQIKPNNLEKYNPIGVALKWIWY